MRASATNRRFGGALVVAVIAVVVALSLSTLTAQQRQGQTGASQAVVKQNGQNATTLAGYKTIDICAVNDTTWRYSGVISVWNQGAIDTVGFAIDDWIQTKVPGSQYSNYLQVPQANIVPAPHEIVAGTTQLTADTYKYWVDGARLDPLYIRNVANLTIMNHSSYVGTPFGPSPKATWVGGQPPACENASGGCTYTQGYWGNKPDVTWPAPYSRDAVFFLSGQTWQQVMDTPVSASQGYYQLAHQYIAAVLNVASGASVPQGVQDTLDDALAWLGANEPAACTGKKSPCGIQKDWAAVLDLYNNGLYPGGPAHCGGEVVPTLR